MFNELPSRSHARDARVTIELIHVHELVQAEQRLAEVLHCRRIGIAATCGLILRRLVSQESCRIRKLVRLRPAAERQLISTPYGLLARLPPQPPGERLRVPLHL